MSSDAPKILVILANEPGAGDPESIVVGATNQGDQVALEILNRWITEDNEIQRSRSTLPYTDLPFATEENLAELKLPAEKGSGWSPDGEYLWIRFVEVPLE